MIRARSCIVDGRSAIKFEAGRALASAASDDGGRP